MADITQINVNGTTYNIKDNTKLPKTTYEWNKEFTAGQNGAISLGRYNLYDTQLTFDITSTTTKSLSGKLVIAAQNGSICQAKVFGDASGALVSKLIIYQSALSNSRSWVEVFCNFDGWSKNKVHIYAVALNSATVEKQMASVTISNGVPATANITSGDTKWTGTIINDNSHTHTTTIAASSGTNELTLAHGTKYAITAGGDSFVFTMPSDNNTNTWRKVQLNGTDKLGTGTGTNPLNIKAGSNMTITESNGTFTFSATDTNTDTNTSHSHSAGVGLVGSGSAGTGSGTYDYKAKLRSETALTVDSAAATTTSGRVYPVAVDKSGYLSVNVPWTNSTNFASTSHKHAYSGTTGAASDEIAAITGVGADGTTTALTGVKVSNSSSAAPGGHTHSVTASGTVTLTDGTAPSMNFNTGSSSDNAYISALSKDGYTPAGSVSLTNGTAPSIGAATIKYLHLGAGTTPVESASISHKSVNSGANSGSGVSVVTGVVGGSGSLTSNDTASGGIAYIASHTAASLGTASTSSAAPGGHTHSYTKATGVTLNASTSEDAGGRWVLDEFDTTTVGSSTHTHTVTVSGTTAAGSSSYRTTVVTGSLSGTTLTLSTTTVPSNSHTHTYGSSTALTTGGPSATTSVVNDCSRIYLKASLSTTSANTGANSGTNFNAVTGYPSFSGGSGTTKYLHHTHTGASASGTSTVAPDAHTHSYDRANSTVSITRGTAPSLTADTTATGGIQYVHAQGTFSAGTTPKASASFTGTNSTAVVTGGTTRRMKFSAGTTPKASASFSGTAVTSGANSGTNFNAATAVGSNGTATVLTGVKATSTASVTASGHTHSYSGTTGTPQ